VCCSWAGRSQRVCPTLLAATVSFNEKLNCWNNPCCCRYPAPHVVQLYPVCRRQLFYVICRVQKSGVWLSVWGLVDLWERTTSRLGFMVCDWHSLVIGKDGVWGKGAKLLCCCRVPTKMLWRECLCACWTDWEQDVDSSQLILWKWKLLQSVIGRLLESKNNCATLHSFIIRRPISRAHVCVLVAASSEWWEWGFLGNKKLHLLQIPSSCQSDCHISDYRLCVESVSWHLSSRFMPWCNFSNPCLCSVVWPVVARSGSAVLDGPKTVF